ncbi:hypothetical protein BaRGS_00031393, partial [Batillaria attramentaria]
LAAEATIVSCTTIVSVSSLTHAVLKDHQPIISCRRYRRVSVGTKGGEPAPDAWGLHFLCETIIPPT